MIKFGVNKDGSKIEIGVDSFELSFSKHNIFFRLLQFFYKKNHRIGQLFSGKMNFIKTKKKEF